MHNNSENIVKSGYSYSAYFLSQHDASMLAERIAFNNTLKPVGNIVYSLS